MFASIMREGPDPAAALKSAAQEMSAVLPDPDLVLVLAAGYPVERLRGPLGRVHHDLPAGTQIIGGTVAGLIHDSREYEQEAAVVIWAGKFPGCRIAAEHLQFLRTLDGSVYLGNPHSAVSPPVVPDPALMLVIADPFSFPVDLLAAQLEQDHPRMPLVGGLLSAGSSPGENLVLVGDEVHSEGCAAVRFPAGIPFSTVVSQGCRPIGEPMIVTAAERNELRGLGGTPALEKLVGLYRSLPTSEQESANQGMQLGIATSEFREQFGYGDFLIRPVIGVVEREKSVVIGDYLKIGKTVQFHIRDHESASVDLEQKLTAARTALLPGRPRAGLLFSCNGRGSRLFPEPDHDARHFCDAAPGMALAGFFAAGEVGPVGAQNFVHGHTATGILFG